jgi:hypothetical protein
VEKPALARDRYSRQSHTNVIVNEDDDRDEDASSWHRRGFETAAPLALREDNNRDGDAPKRCRQEEAEE